MGLLSVLLHPLATINRWLENDPNGSGIDMLYLLTAFIGLGIWLVVRRHLHNVNRAIPFEWDPELPVAPDWKSLPIPNPSLESHLRDPKLLPSVASEGRRFITSYDPSNGLHIGTFLADDEGDIDRKIRLAADAQKSWKTTTFGERRRVIRSLNKWLVDNQDICARTACRDTGKTLIDASLGEVLTTCSKMEWLMNHGERALRPESRSNPLALSYKKSQVYHEPLGVVAAIVSWNYPLHNSWSPILAAIFSGNGIVLKCSEHVVWSSLWFVGAIQECLFTCGYDPELVQVVCCWPEQAPALTRSPLIKHITFIGSEPVGRQIAMDATVNLTPVTLELGGKDPAIILPGTDLKKWSSLWMRGTFQNVGQNCIGIERFIVHASQHDELYAMFQDRTSKLRAGSVLTASEEGFVPTIDCGAMISRDRFEGLEAIISSAQRAGALVSAEMGKGWKHSYHEHGCYFHPTVVGNVTPEMDIAQHELFAPVAVLIPYKTVDEAVAIANGTRYGLGASVFGPWQSECKQVAQQLECGMVSLNDFAVFYLNQDLPFGGIKGSGYGRFGGPEGLLALTNPKVIVSDRFPSIIQTSIPKVLDYPIRSLVQSWEFVSGLVAFLYADSRRARIHGLIRLVQAARK
ncbi:hypothetical protein PLICRDRAFT_53690 [Plicaturopsis crispa FD-325 SS-3]|nr:hypothetical protein PLICRDRAFT_53690 [Plicaturopsis crispa FD-325 SS-3]